MVGKIVQSFWAESEGYRGWKPSGQKKELMTVPILGSRVLVVVAVVDKYLGIGGTPTGGVRMVRRLQDRSFRRLHGHLCYAGS